MKAHIVALSAVAIVSMAGNGYLYQQLDQLNTSYESLNSSYVIANAEFAEQAKLGETLAKEAESLKAEIAKKEALAAEAAKTVSDEEVLKQIEYEKSASTSDSKSDNEYTDKLTEIGLKVGLSKEEVTSLIEELMEKGFSKEDATNRVEGLLKQIESEQLIEPKKPTSNKPKSDNGYADIPTEKLEDLFKSEYGFSDKDAKNLVYALQNYSDPTPFGERYDKSKGPHYEGPLYGTSLDYYPTEYQELILELYQITLNESREEIIKTFTPYDPWEGVPKSQFICEEVRHDKPSGRPYHGLG